MIDIVQYRAQIGCFSQQTFRKKFLRSTENVCKSVRNKNKCSEHFMRVISVVLKITVFCVLFLCPAPPPPPPPAWTGRGWPAWCASSSCTVGSSWTTSVARTQPFHLYYSSRTVWRDNVTEYKRVLGVETGNFWARYTNGNIRKDKGIHNIHLNIRSLKFKAAEIKNIVQAEKPTILGLSECELKKENLDPKTLKVPGYVILYPKSWESEGFARVVVYVKKSFNFKQVHDLEDNQIQSVWLKGSYKNSKQIFFCHAYREHVSSMGGSISNQKVYLNKFLSQWEAATDYSSVTEPNEVHISGDMNLDFLPAKWLQPSYRLYSLTRLVQNICNSYNFTQLVKEPTRIMYNSVARSTESSCIDHVYCNYRHRCSSPRVIVSGASDHDMVSYIRYSKGPSTPSRKIGRRSYKNFVETDYLADLGNIDWNDVLATEDLDRAVDILTEKLNFVLNKHAPWKVFQLRKSFCPWLTDETKELMKERDTWKKKAKQLATDNPGQVTAEQHKAWVEYKKIRNKINNLKRSEEIEFKKNKIEENIDDSAKVWKLTKSFMDWKTTGTPTQLEENGSLVTSARSISQIMNSYFIDKVRALRQSMASVVLNMAPCMKVMKNKNCRLSLSHISAYKVRKLLNSLSNSRSTAMDGLDNFSVKMAAPVIAVPLHHIITLSIMQQEFPRQWKSSKVLPLHKKNDVLSKKNYRPVAILSPLSKVLEKCIYEQLYRYFKENEIFHPNIHGYRTNRSTQTALLQMYDHWVQAASQGQVSGAVLLDLSAAFDLVPPDTLVKKLKVYGLDEGFLTWINSYMTGRCQGVWIDHVLSDLLPCDVGVPQGSNLGPLLFMIYVNDLPSVLTCHTEQYADDSTLHATGKTCDEIQRELENNCEVVSNWMGENMLQLNADKTHVMTIGTRERLAQPGNQISVSMDGIRLEENPEHRETLLGIIIDANLKWHGQIEFLLKKLKSRLAGLAHVRSVLPYHLRKVVSESLFTSVLSYCLPLFGGCDIGQIQDLQVLQNKAAQLATKSPPRSPRHPMYDRLGWLSVNQLIQYHTVLAVYRVRSTGEPEYLARNLCNDNRNGHIIIKNTRLTLLQKSFKFRGACNWNDLPESIRNLQTIAAFKRALRSWINEHTPRFLD